MTDTPVHVDPAALHADGIRCTTAAHDTENALTTIDTVVRESGTGFATSSAPAFEAVSNRLDARRRELTAAMTRLGESLQAAAQGYRKTDGDTADSVGAAGGSPGLNLEP